MINQILNKSLLKVLNEKQVNKYDETGFLFIESFVKKEWLSDLKDITYKMQKNPPFHHHFYLQIGHLSIF